MRVFTLSILAGLCGLALAACQQGAGTGQQPADSPAAPPALVSEFPEVEPGGTYLYNWQQVAGAAPLSAAQVRSLCQNPDAVFTDEDAARALARWANANGHTVLVLGLRTPVGWGIALVTLTGGSLAPLHIANVIEDDTGTHPGQVEIAVAADGLSASFQVPGEPLARAQFSGGVWVQVGP